MNVKASSHTLFRYARRKRVWLREMCHLASCQMSVSLLAFVVLTVTRVSPVGSLNGAAKMATDHSLQRRLEVFIRGPTLIPSLARYG